MLMLRMSLDKLANSLGFAGKLDLRIVRIHDAFEQLRAQFEHKLMPSFDKRICANVAAAR